MPSPLSMLRDLTLYEGVDVEFKAAKGGLPRDLWETYSAFANTDGGTIWLGITQGETALDMHGVENAEKLVSDFWNTINNRGKVCLNLLTNDLLEIVPIEGSPRKLIRIRVPRAGRRERPVFLGSDPFRGTYRRNFEGDYLCRDDEVRRMFADQSEEPADSRLLIGFGWDDLHSESIKQFRNRFSSRASEHPWLAESDSALLEKLGGWRRDRSTGQEGLTLAGLLMFGRSQAITAAEAVPGFQLDYRERLSDDPAVRWTDRLTLDGMWEGNLFQFYQRVMVRLAEGLRTPFQRDQAGYRKAETPVHEALQEALVNALVHADYSGQGGIVIDRFADRIEISNPGTLLLSREQILRGGVSECRNKSLQRMFQMLGVGDKAGSGIDKIRSGWASQHWRSPGLQETLRPDRVMLVLAMVSMLPQPTVDGLRQRFGPAFGKLKVDEVQALVTADLEGEVSNQRLQEMSSSHPVDITKVLQGLVRKGMLEPSGTGRGTRYRLVSGDSLHKAEDSSHKDVDSLHKTGDSSHWVATTVTDEMRVTAEHARQSSRIAPAKLEQILVSLCSGQFVPLDLLAEAVNRNAEGLRNRYLTPLVRQGRLRLRFPDRKNRPDQAYLAVGDK